MTDRRANRLWIISLLALAGGLAGLLAAPALSRTHYLVQAAERVWLEESEKTPERTLQSSAFRATGIPLKDLFEDARGIRDRFRTGSTLFGLWCGLAAGLKIASILSRRAGREYEAEAGHCLACGRCFLSCPVERKRLRSSQAI
jgi:ferredoxin